MSIARRITATAIMALWVFLIWSSVTHSQDERGRKRLPDEDSSARKGSLARPEPTPPDSPPQPDTPEPPTPQTKPGSMSAEEKLVRDVYARLMRYQSAARDELAARNGLSSGPEDYLTFELRHIHTGPIEEIYYRLLAEMVTGRSGATINLTPTHLSNGNDPAHAYYAAEWSQPDIDADRDDPTFESASRKLKRAISTDEEPLYPVDQSFTTRTNTVGEMLRKGGKRYANVEKYTSYEVTVHLDGKQRTYRALVFHHVKNAWNLKENERANRDNPPARQASAELLDNVTSEMNAVLNDESPQVRSPWNKYVNTSLYVTVTRTITATKAAGRPLRPADAPIGYLPGDDATVSTKDNQMMMANVPCVLLTVDIVDVLGTKFTNTNQAALLDANSQLLAQVSDDGSGAYQWSVGGGNDYQLTNSTLTDSSIVVRWTKEGSYDVSVTYTNNNQQAQAAFKVTVVRPLLDSLSATEVTPQVYNAPTQCGGGGGITSLSLGCGDSVANSGILFTASAKVPKKFISEGGKIKWVQIANSSSNRIPLAGGGTPQCRTSGSSWMLDDSDPYASSGTVNNLPVISEFNYSAGTASIGLNDSPFNPVDGYSPFVRTDSFKIYVVYFTQDDQGHPRTQRVIGVLQWSWSGEADYNSQTQTYSLHAGNFSPTQTTTITGTAVNGTVSSINDLQPYSGRIQDLTWGNCP